MTKKDANTYAQAVQGSWELTETTVVISKIQWQWTDLWKKHFPQYKRTRFDRFQEGNNILIMMTLDSFEGRLRSLRPKEIVLYNIAPTAKQFAELWFCFPPSQKYPNITILWD
jgi:hypothetical protein